MSDIDGHDDWCRQGTVSLAKSSQVGLRHDDDMQVRMYGSSVSQCCHCTMVTNMKLYITLNLKTICASLH